MQLFEYLHAQDAQHVLPGPGHREEGRAGQYRAEHKQGDHHQDKTEQSFDALGSGGCGRIHHFEAAESVSVVNQPAG